MKQRVTEFGVSALTKLRRWTAIACALTAAALASTARAEIDAHPLVPGDTAYREIELTVGGVAVPVVDFYRTCYAHMSHDEAGEVEVAITAVDPIAECSVFPRRLGIEPEVRGNTMRFRFSGPEYLYIKINQEKKLMLLVSPLPQDVPKPGDREVSSLGDYGVDATGSTTETARIQKAIDDVAADPVKRVLFVPPGRYKSGSIRLKKDVMLYLDEGALLMAADRQADFSREAPRGPYGRYVFIGAEDADGCGIDGRGVIDGNGVFLRTQYQWPVKHEVKGRLRHPVDANRLVNVCFSHCDDSFLKGVISRNTSSWNTVPYYGDRMLVQDYKVVSSLATLNEDAIDPDSVVDFTIRDSFFMAHDDGIVFKNCGSYQSVPISPDGKTRDMHNVLVKNNVVYSETAALKYGQNESETSINSGFRFENNDVVSGLWGFKAHPLGEGVIRNWVFIGNHYDELNTRRKDRKPLNIHLQSPGSNCVRFIDETHYERPVVPNVCEAKDVEFRNVTVAGKPLTDDPKLIKTKGQGIRFSSSEE